MVPCAVQLNHGTTNTSSTDPIGDFEGLVAKYDLWLHVDAAYAGASWILPEYQSTVKDIQRVATSFNFNGSKWFLCGFDSGFLFIRDRMKQVYAFQAGGDYLAPDANSGIYDPEFKDWAIPLGRRFRSLRIWMVSPGDDMPRYALSIHHAVDLLNQESPKPAPKLAPGWPAVPSPAIAIAAVVLPFSIRIFHTHSSIIPVVVMG